MLEDRVAVLEQELAKEKALNDELQRRICSVQEEKETIRSQLQENLDKAKKAFKEENEQLKVAFNKRITMLKDQILHLQDDLNKESQRKLT